MGEDESRDMWDKIEEWENKGPKRKKLGFRRAIEMGSSNYWIVYQMIEVILTLENYKIILELRPIIIEDHINLIIHNVFFIYI